MYKNFVLIIFGLFLFSCVPNKNIIYFQGNPKQSDKIQRINNVPYKLQVDDNIIINIKSEKEELVSMFKKDGNSSGSSGNSNNNNGNESFSSGSGYFNGFSIDNHGNIRIPYLGAINVLGYTTTEVRKKLEEEFKKYFNDNNDIFISVKLSGIRYTIIGEINEPGTRIVYQNRVNIIEAIANSGDITIVGNRKEVEVIRMNPTGQEKFVIDLTNIDAFNSDIFYIKSNDIIQILPLPQKSLGIGTTGLQSLTTIISVFSLLTSVIIIAKNL